MSNFPPKPHFSPLRQVNRCHIYNIYAIIGYMNEPIIIDDELKAILAVQNGGEVPTEASPAVLESALKQQFLLSLVMARRQAHLTQTEVAKKAGMTQSSLARIETGRANPTLTTLLRIAHALEFRLNLLK